MALFVAGAAAYFSIYGLALIFSGAMVPVIIMASALEVGKLCATSVVYNYWDKLGWLMRTYLTSAIVVLMLITSGGIYGFLSAAYQKDQLPLEQINAKIELLDAEYDRKTARLKQMDDTVAAISSNYITKRLEEKAQQKSERDLLDARINEIEAEKLNISTNKLETEAHIGPIIYMAKAFGQTTDQATNWLILLFIFAFDPLAVALTIVANMLMRLRDERIDRETPECILIEDIPPPIGDPVSKDYVDTQAFNPVVEDSESDDKPEHPISTAASKPEIERESTISNSETVEDFIIEQPGAILEGVDNEVDSSDFSIEILKDPKPQSNNELESVNTSIKQLQDAIQTIRDDASSPQEDQNKDTKPNLRSELIRQIRSNTLD